MQENTFMTKLKNHNNQKDFDDLFKDKLKKALFDKSIDIVVKVIQSDVTTIEYPEKIQDLNDYKVLIKLFKKTSFYDKTYSENPMFNVIPLNKIYPELKEECYISLYVKNKLLDKNIFIDPKFYSKEALQEYLLSFLGLNQYFKLIYNYDLTLDNGLSLTVNK